MMQIILDAVNAINPLDDLEQEHKDNVLAWVKSGAPLFRISKPDNPPKHLVSYFVLYDPRSSQLMLIDHIKGCRPADMWKSMKIHAQQ
jgi:8-oxo-dGTP diphosphatase